MSANDSRMSCPWSDCRPRYVIAGAVAVAALLLSGCASLPHPEYWEHGWPSNRKVAPMEVIANVIPCGGGYIDCLGVYDQTDDVVYIRAGLSPALTDCVRTHEHRHAGWDARNNKPLKWRWDHADEATLAIDCGDGTVMSSRLGM